MLFQPTLSSRFLGLALTSAQEQVAIPVLAASALSFMPPSLCETGSRCFFILAFPEAEVVGAAALRGKPQNHHLVELMAKLHPHSPWTQLLLLPFHALGSWRSLGF